MLDVLRVFFAVAILLYHAEHLKIEPLFKLVPGGYIAVEFFFILSGALMAKSARNLQIYESMAKETVRFIVKKIKGFILPYSLIWLLGLLVRLIQMDSLSFRYVIESVWQLLFCEMAGLDQGYRVEGAWYLSAMLIGMLILYPLLLRFYDYTAHILAPLMAITIYGNLYQTIGHLNVVRTFCGIFYAGVFRGIAGMCMGILAFCFSEWLKSTCTKHNVFLFFIEFSCYMVSLLCMSWKGYTAIDFSQVLFLTCGLTITLSECAKISLTGTRAERYTQHFGKFSLMLYLIHPTIYVWLGYFQGMSRKSLILIYLMGSLIGAFAFGKICAFIERHLLRKL